MVLYMILQSEPTYHQNNILFFGYSSASSQVFNMMGIIYL